MPDEKEEMRIPSPSEELILDKPYEVELLRLPGDDPKRELLQSLESAYTLIKSKDFDQAGMLYDIIDPRFKKLESSLSGEDRKRLLRLYNEVTLYLWMNEAYLLAQKRHISQLSNLVVMIARLMEEVLNAGPIDNRPYAAAKSQLSFIGSVLAK